MMTRNFCDGGDCINMYRKQAIIIIYSSRMIKKFELYDIIRLQVHRICEILTRDTKILLEHFIRYRESFLENCR